MTRPDAIAFEGEMPWEPNHASDGPQERLGAPLGDDPGVGRCPTSPEAAAAAERAWCDGPIGLAPADYAKLLAQVERRSLVVDAIGLLARLHHRPIGCRDKTAFLDLLRQIWLLDHGPAAEHGAPCDHAKRASTPTNPGDHHE